MCHLTAYGLGFAWLFYGPIFANSGSHSLAKDWQIRYFGELECSFLKLFACFQWKTLENVTGVDFEGPC